MNLIDVRKKISKLESERKYLLKKIKKYEKRLIEVTEAIRVIYCDL